MNALRLHRGFLVTDFGARTGLPATALAGALSGAAARGLVRASEDAVRPTPLGRAHLNTLLRYFLDA